MRKFHLFMLCLLIWAAELPAQTDTVTISWSGSSLRYYLAVNDSYQLVATPNISEAALWERTYLDKTQFTLTNIVASDAGEVNTALSVAYYTAVLSKNSQVFQYANSRITTLIDGKSYIMTTSNKSTNLPTFSRQWTYTSGIQIDTWQLVNINALSVQFSPEDHYFGITTDPAYSDTLLLQVSMRYETALYYRSGTQRIYLESQRTVTAPSELSALGLTPSFAWRSTGSETSLLQGQVMMRLCRSDIAANASGWTVPIVAIGASPMNLREDGNWVDYRDALEVTVPREQAVESFSTFVTRRSYHTEDLPVLTLQASPSTYLMSSEGETLDIVLRAIYQEGTMYITTDNLPIRTVYRVAPHTLDIQDPALRLYTTYASTTEPISYTTWAQIVREDSVFHVTAADNPDPISRGLSIALTGVYTTEEGQEMDAIQCYVNQQARGASAKMKYTPYVGCSGTTLDEAGRQRTHQSDKTMYVIPGENVTLMLQESAFAGYMRWYEYEHAYDIDGINVPAQWVVEPKGAGRSGKSFTLINSGKDSKGRYTVSSNLSTARNENTSPQVRVNSDCTTPVLIACDVSNYTDGYFGTDSIREPTLSYREVFHLLPAAWMADSLAQCGLTRPFEEHVLYAPAHAKTVYLVPDHDYQNSSSDTYIYRSGSTYKHVGASGAETAAWYKNGVKMATQSGGNAYMTIQSSVADTADYDLKTEHYWLAHFRVIFLPANECGPTKNDIISAEKIEEDYRLLKRIDFNYDRPGTKAIVLSDRHLQWPECSYGFYYQSLAAGNHRHAGDNTFPYWGEYVLINRVNESWAQGEQHGGAEYGYMLYCDGTQNPGLVAAIEIDTTLCSGQQIYCSAYLCNPCPAKTTGSLPIFRFNVQGRFHDGEWEDISVFMVGSIEKNSGWQQVIFPVVPEKDYDEYRVSLYNFATSNSGNDFMIDDLCLFATDTPLHAYRTGNACQPHEAVDGYIRLDYSKLVGDWAGKPIYYDMYDETTDEVVREVASYVIPPVDYDPRTTADSIYVYDDLIDLLDSLASDPSRAHRGFMQEEVMGENRFVIYMAHRLQLAHPDHSYISRFAASIDELDNAMCALRAELPYARVTSIALDDGSTVISPQRDICANSLYSLAIDLEYSTAETTIHGTGMGDWLVGYAFDTVYAETMSSVPDIDLLRHEADSLFLLTYGYTRHEVQSALLYDLRRIGSESSPNPNRFVTDITAVDPRAFNDGRNYRIISDLVDRGLLRLGLHQWDAYLGSQDRVMQWVFPIDGTGKGIHPLTLDTIIMPVCAQPQWIDMLSNETEYRLSFQDPTLLLNDVPALDIPVVRTSAYLANRDLVVPIGDIANVIMGWDSTQIVDTNDPILLDKMRRLGGDPTRFSVRYNADRIFQQVHLSGYYRPGDVMHLRPIDESYIETLRQYQQQGTYGIWSAGHPGFQYANTDTLRPGYWYTFRTTMLTLNMETTQHEEDAQLMDIGNCRVGDSYFRVFVVPDTLVWTPEIDAYTDWSLDGNWRCVVDGKTMNYGFAPLANSVVIIPEQTSQTMYPQISGVRPYADYGFSATQCHDIYFRPGTEILNQHLLHYNRAFVDMTIPSGDWLGIATPLQDVYAGDMYISVNDRATPYKVSPFDYQHQTRSYPYLFYQEHYNDAGITMHTTEDREQLMVSSRWYRSNHYSDRYLPGTGYAVLGFGPTDEKIDLVVRLPKQETGYKRYLPDGQTLSGQTEETPKTASHRLAYTLDDGCDYMTITLTNTTADTYFSFGNPTMASIDMYAFIADNPDLLPAYSYLENSTWIQSTRAAAVTPELSLLPPMRAALLRTSNPRTSLTLRLRPEHLTLSQDGTRPTEEVAAPRRHRAPEPAADRRLIRLYAHSGEGSALLIVGESATAADEYQAGEDAMLTTSGYSEQQDIETPLCLYSVLGREAMSVDIRQHLDTVALGLLTTTVTDSLRLIIHLDGDWHESPYLLDSLTHMRYPLVNALTLWLAMDTHPRYYLIPPYHDDGNSTYTVPTSVEPSQPEQQDTKSDRTLPHSRYNLLGIPVDESYRGIVITEAHKLLLP